ncbi:YecA family protein [Flavobacterium davisii]|uniref:Zinc chelation protein SecC n=1 Tax=Flavobacterium davisii TaxID=2906077 RepID=A0A246GLM1_9FLAO|nr:SEC-C metal-binding domain-containing protein [Flavobacterium davisii]OWP85332.1 hypothetical protein BWK59_00310 [Flavobacterium davisii]
MKENNIWDLLIELENITDLKLLQEQIQVIKEEALLVNDQHIAKECWIAQSILQIHFQYREAFDYLRKKEYYKAWCELERVEIEFHDLKRHFDTKTNSYGLYKIEKGLRNLQILYPYKLFGSVELLKKKKKCSVCDKEISIRRPCGHLVGEIYNGEICHRIVTDVEVLGMALVQDPGNKFSVMFIKDETGNQTDHYNYYPLEYLFSVVNDPYEDWDLEISERYVKESDFKCGRNDKCECGSGLKFKKCCLKTIGNTYPHYVFLFPKDLITNLT